MEDRIKLPSDEHHAGLHPAIIAESFTRGYSRDQGNVHCLP